MKHLLHLEQIFSTEKVSSIRLLFLISSGHSLVTFVSVYPMDYYSKNGGDWTNFKQDHRGGSLAAKFALSSLPDLQKRRTLIRQRAEERRKRMATP